MLNVIRDWTTLSNDPYPNRIVPERPPVAARNLAMVHGAMVDAVNAIERTHEHSTFSGAAAVVLSSIFGPNMSFTSTSDAHTGFTQRPLDPRQIATRSFTSFAEAADEAARSRLYAGIHFEFDNAAGLSSGRALGILVVETILGPLDSGR